MDFVVGKVVLNDAGAVSLGRDEIWYCNSTDVDIYDREVKVQRGGTLTITSHRLAWVCDTDSAVWHLSQLMPERLAAEAGGVFASPKIVAEVRPPVGYKGIVPPSGATYIKLSFKKGGRDEALEMLTKAVNRKAWALAPIPAAMDTTVKAEAVAAMPGIDFLRAQAAELARKREALTAEAFEDLSKLESLAKPLVALAERYAAEARRKSASADGGGSGAGSNSPAVSGGAGSPGPSSDDVAALFTSMGIVDPITRETAGRTYIQQVARQLASVLKPLLERSGGMMPLTDVYCGYNRARVTDLISPEDLLQAARQMQALRCGCHLVTFPSGLVAIQLDSFSQDAAVARIVDMLDAASPVSAGGAASNSAEAWASDACTSPVQLATQWKIPLQVAQQHLMLAEGRGALCRDDSIHGVRYYINRF